MAKKKKKKHQKKEGPNKLNDPGNKIEFKEKIILETSDHSYKSYFFRRYGKYVRKVTHHGNRALKILGTFFLVIFLSLLTIFLFFGRDLPDVSKLKDISFAETTTIYDKEGNILYSIYGEENRKYVPLKSISKDAINATIAIEDKSFYHHLGFDVSGIIRAQLKNFEQDSIRQGASTITQQLARNIFLTPEQTYERKIKELLLAMQIEILFPKDEILEMYLNKIAYGSNAFGIEAAAKTFFGKSASSLTLIEAVVLASLPKGPSYYSPYGQNRKELMGYCKSATNEPVTIEDNEEPETTLASKAINSEVSTQEVATKPQPVCVSLNDDNYVWGRKDYVLDRLLADGYITKDQIAQAWKEGTTLQFIDPIHKIEAPHFVFYVRQLLEEKYGKELVESGGLQVKTSLDPRLQSIAEEMVGKHAERNLKNYGANNAGFVAINPKNGDILAMVGSVDYWDNNINGQVNVTTSSRQPGSTFKPLIFAAAIENAGIGSGSIISDYKTVFNKKDVPRDYDGKYLGRMTVRTALGGSRNIPAIKAYYLAGEEEKVLDFLDKIGLISLRKFKESFNQKALERGWTFDYGWPMAIGSGEVKLLDLVGAYTVFANGGNYYPLNPLLEVRNRKGEIIEDFYKPEGKQVIDPQVAYIINDMLSDIAARPPGSWRSLLTIPGHNVAAKTGTSNKKIGRTLLPNNDLTIGYTPSLAAGVWVGNTDGKNMRSNAYSLYTTDPIYHDFFVAALKDQAREEFPKPENIITVGREVYPSFRQNKNWDSLFVTIEDTEETQGSEQTEATESQNPDENHDPGTTEVEIPEGWF